MRFLLISSIGKSFLFAVFGVRLFAEEAALGFRELAVAFDRLAVLLD